MLLQCLIRTHSLNRDLRAVAKFFLSRSASAGKKQTPIKMESDVFG